MMHVDPEIEEEVLLGQVVQAQGWERILRLVSGGVEIAAALGYDDEGDLDLPDEARALVEEAANEIADHIGEAAQALSRKIATVMSEVDDA